MLSIRSLRPIFPRTTRSSILLLLLPFILTATMLWSNICQLPLGLLLTCLSSSSASAIMSRGPIVKRDPEYNVLGGVNFPDPSIWEVDGVSYVFGTVDGNGHNVPMTSNSDFTDASGWSAITDAFPQEDVPAVGSGGWAVANTAWAPDVNQLVSILTCCLWRREVADKEHRRTAMAASSCTTRRNWRPTRAFTAWA